MPKKKKKSDVAFTMVMNEQDANWLRAKRLREIVEMEPEGSEDAIKAAQELEDLENNIVDGVKYDS